MDARARYNHAAVEYDGYGTRTGVADSNDNSNADTVSGYFVDPDGGKLRRRKESYAGRCVDCNRPTDGTAGKGKAAERCAECRSLHDQEAAVWTAETIEACALALREEPGMLPLVV